MVGVELARGFQAPASFTVALAALEVQVDLFGWFQLVSWAEPKASGVEKHLAGARARAGEVRKSSGLTLGGLLSPSVEVAGAWQPAARTRTQPECFARQEESAEGVAILVAQRAVRVSVEHVLAKPTQRAAAGWEGGRSDVAASSSLAAGCSPRTAVTVRPARGREEWITFAGGGWWECVLWS